MHVHVTYCLIFPKPFTFYLFSQKERKCFVIRFAERSLAVVQIPFELSKEKNNRSTSLPCFLSLQLNGSTVGDVYIKVSIARKQPMLDAATGKSVWASLGSYKFPTSVYNLSDSASSYELKLHSPLSLYFYSCPEQY